MSDISKLYIKSGVVSFIAKISNIVSAFAVLWLLNAVMGKEDFGHFILAVTIYLVVASVFASGIKDIVVYRISRMHARSEETHVRQELLMGQALFLGLCVGALISVLSYLAAPLLGHWEGKAPLVMWLVWLSPIAVCHVLNLVLSAWYHAKQQVPTMLVYVEILPNAMRVLGLLFVWIFGADIKIVAGVYVAAYLVPTAVLYLRKPFWPRFHDWQITLWDLSYGAKVMFTQLMHKPAKSIDLLFVGFLASAQATAEYALASRFVIVLTLGKQIVLNLFHARIGQLLENGDHDGLLTEYRMTQIFGLVSGIVVAIILVAFGPYLVSLFGDYDAAYPILVLLCCANIIRLSTGMNGEYLLMAGYAGWTFISTLIGLAGFALVGWLLIDSYGALGGALALIASVFVNNLLVSVVIWHKDRFAVLNISTILISAVNVGVFMAISFGLLNVFVGSAILVLSLILYLWREMKIWMPMITFIVQKLFKGAR